MQFTRTISRSSRLACAAALVLVLALATACTRKEDPYRDWKAPQMLDEGDRLLRANDLAAADKTYVRGIEKAQQAGVSADKMRVFLARRLAIAQAREDLETARTLFAATGADKNMAAMDVRVVTQLVVMLQRSGKIDEARALGEKLAQRLAAKSAQPEELPFYVAGWIAIDRLRSANVELTRAKEASAAVVATITEFASQSHAIGPGLRPWLARYVDHLFDSDRTLVAQEIADLIGRIDQLVPYAGPPTPCIPLDETFTALGCLAEWK